MSAPYTIDDPDFGVIAADFPGVDSDDYVVDSNGSITNG